MKGLSSLLHQAAKQKAEEEIAELQQYVDSEVEEAAAKKKVEEEAARKKAEEEGAARKKKEEEEAAAKKKAEEEGEKKKTEEVSPPLTASLTYSPVTLLP